ncbi:thioredoxin domain-containing protein [Marispirochaeta aestuarii]|nr:hypothetical protein [Marispirochaeta aestuarii]
MSDSQKKTKLMEVSVCIGTNCAFRGASQLMEALVADKEIREKCTIHEISCQNDMCDHSRRSPVVRIDGDYFLEARPEVILDEVHRRIAMKKIKA